MSRKLLLIGRTDSAHLLRWASLCRDIGLDVREFEPDGTRHALRGFPAPHDADQANAFSAAREEVVASTAAAIAAHAPDVVQVCGLDPFGMVAAAALARLEHELTIRRPSLVVQVRGGYELMIAARDHATSEAFSQVLGVCDGLLVDHDRNFEACVKIGLSASAISRRIRPVPGGGGIHRSEIEAAALAAPRSGTATVLWPKAYLSVGVDGLVVAEGLRRAFERTGGFDIQALFCFQEDFRLTLGRIWPDAMLSRASISAVVPWSECLMGMSRSWVMVAPSLLDGIPNVLIEAMALGALPVVSDHGFLPPDWYAGSAIRFAHNLDPDAIASAVVSTLDACVCPPRMEQETAINRERSHAHADRERIAQSVRDFYASL